MSRTLPNWIDAYLDYTKETESAAIYHKWTAISIIAGVLRRKVWFNFGRIKIYPNLYIVFVSEPGISRKTQAISFGEEILTEISGITLAADTTTVQALLDDLQDCVTAHLIGGDNFSHASLNIYSGEFESFLGDKRENRQMLVTLTDLFDCKKRPFKTRTRHSGSTEIPSPFLNLLAATTPDSLANSLPSTAVGGGLTSRMIFLWADEKEKKIDIPEEPPKELKTALIQDLAVISRIAGGYRFSDEGREWWRTFYHNYDEKDPNRICKDVAFKGWYSRKPMFIVKLATILTASRTNEMQVGPPILDLALITLEDAERKMVKTFGAVGRSLVTADVEMVRTIISSHKIISESQLFQMVWRDIDSKKFDTVIHTILRSGEVGRSFTGPNGEKGIFYHWNTTKKRSC